MRSRFHDSSGDAIPGAVRRLTLEFPAMPRPEVVQVVRASRSDLAGVPTGAVPELLERLARERLLMRRTT